MVATEQSTLRLNRLEIESFLRVRALQVYADGRHVILSGANGVGKTSAIDAIWAALKGTRAKDTPEPIHRVSHADRRRIPRSNTWPPKPWLTPAPTAKPWPPQRTTRPWPI